MGKYKEQAISYKMGMDMLRASLMDILEKIKDPDGLTESESTIQDVQAQSFW